MILPAAKLGCPIYSWRQRIILGQPEKRPNYGTAQRVPQNVPREQSETADHVTAGPRRFTDVSIQRIPGRRKRPPRELVSSVFPFSALSVQTLRCLSGTQNRLCRCQLTKQPPPVTIRVGGGAV